MFWPFTGQDQGRPVRFSGRQTFVQRQKALKIPDFQSFIFWHAFCMYKKYKHIYTGGFTYENHRLIHPY